MKDRAHWPDDLKCDFKEPSVPLVYDSQPVKYLLQLEILPGYYSTSSFHTRFVKFYNIIAH
jgi:hypothetical protein